MGTNYMETIAKMLGVELEEEFRIYGCDGFCKITELGLERYVKERSWFMDSIMLMDLIKGTAKIIKLPKPILTDKEKEYLSAVIKPFRDSVVAIIKCKYDDYYEFIQIEVNQERYEYVNLPNFKSGTMYKGMELDKEYTLNELGL